MNKAHNFVSIDNPNIGLLDPDDGNRKPFGEFLPGKGDPQIDADVLGAFRSHDLYLPNFSLREYKGQYNHDVVLSNHEGIGLDMMGVCLILKGVVKSYVKDHEICEPSFNFSQNFKYDPHNDFKHWVMAKKPFHIAHFEVRAKYFTQFLPEHESWSDFLINTIEKRGRISGKRFFPIVSAQERAMQNILDCPLQGKLAFMIMEASLVQIILLQLYSIFGNGITTQNRLSKRDHELVYGVRDFISKNFLDDHSLASLSRQFATNTNKLMSLFKAAFGESIFDYIASQRMQYAKEMLRDDQRPVNEVARILGYKNANHFSTAFRKKFGFSPSDVRKTTSVLSQ